MNGSLVNLNCVGMQCPAPILAISKAAKTARRPTVMEVRADDGDFEKDVRAWCRSTGAVLESIEQVSGTFVARISIKDGPTGANATPAALDRSATPTSAPRAGDLRSEPVAIRGEVGRGEVGRGEAARIDLDCRGMRSGEVIAHMSRVSRGANRPSHVIVRASDRGFKRDLETWCSSNRAELFSFAESEGYFVATIGIHGAPPPLPEMPIPGMTGPIGPIGREVVSAAPARQTTSSLGDRVNADPPSSLRNSVIRTPSGAPAPAPVDLRGQVAELALLQLGQRVIDQGKVDFVGEDPLLERHLSAWAQVVGAEIEVFKEGPLFRGSIRLDPRSRARPSTSLAVADAQGLPPRKNKATLMMLRNDFESLVAGLLTANACAAQGMEVEMLFSFWGVNVLRAAVPRAPGPDEKPVPVMKKMMKWMMPAGPEAQQMSKMNMGGMGVEMMKYFMAKDNILGMRQLMQQAADNGVKFVVCTMSMGVMGITKSDLHPWPNLEFGGVVSFTSSARESAISLVF